MRTLYQRRLGGDFDVTLVENGNAARDAARQSFFHVFLFDELMPIMNGPEALRQLRLEHVTTPAALVTANAISSDIVEYGRARGFDTCFSKPVHFNRLIVALLALVQNDERATEDGNQSTEKSDQKSPLQGVSAEFSAIAAPN